MTLEQTIAFCVVVICSSGLLAFRWMLEFKEIELEPTVSVDEFEQMKTAVGQVKIDHESVKKLAEEAKEKLSGLNLAGAFGRRNG